MPTTHTGSRMNSGSMARVNSMARKGSTTFVGRPVSTSMSGFLPTFGMNPSSTPRANAYEEQMEQILEQQEKQRRAQRNQENNMLKQRHQYHEGKTGYHKGMHDYHAQKLQYYQMRAKQHWNPFKRLSAQMKIMKHQQGMQKHYNLGTRQSMKARKRAFAQQKLDAQRILQNLGPNPAPRKKGSAFWFPH